MSLVCSISDLEELVDGLLDADLIKFEVTSMPPVKLSSLFTRFKMYSFVFFFLINWFHILAWTSDCSSYDSTLIDWVELKRFMLGLC